MGNQQKALMSSGGIRWLGLLLLATSLTWSMEVDPLTFDDSPTIVTLSEDLGSTQTNVSVGTPTGSKDAGKETTTWSMESTLRGILRIGDLKSEVRGQSKQLETQQAQIKTLQQGMSKLQQQMKLALTFSRAPTATPTIAPTESPTMVPTGAPTGAHLSPFETPILSAKLNMTRPNSLLTMPVSSYGSYPSPKPRTMVGLTRETAVVCSWTPYNTMDTNSNEATSCRVVNFSWTTMSLTEGKNVSITPELPISNGGANTVLERLSSSKVLACVAYPDPSGEGNTLNRCSVLSVSGMTLAKGPDVDIKFNLGNLGFIQGNGVLLAGLNSSLAVVCTAGSNMQFSGCNLMTLSGSNLVTKTTKTVDAQLLAVTPVNSTAAIFCGLVQGNPVDGDEQLTKCGIMIVEQLDPDHHDPTYRTKFELTYFTQLTYPRLNLDGPPQLGVRLSKMDSGNLFACWAPQEMSLVYSNDECPFGAKMDDGGCASGYAVYCSTMTYSSSTGLRVGSPMIMESLNPVQDFSVSKLTSDTGFVCFSQAVPKDNSVSQWVQAHDADNFEYASRGVCSVVGVSKQSGPPTPSPTSAPTNAPTDCDNDYYPCQSSPPPPPIPLLAATLIQGDMISVSSSNSSMAFFIEATVLSPGVALTCYSGGTEASNGQWKGGSWFPGSGTLYFPGSKVLK